MFRPLYELINVLHFLIAGNAQLDLVKLRSTFLKEDYNEVEALIFLHDCDLLQCEQSDLKMDEHIFYRIISKQPKPSQLKTSQQFHRSAPFKMYHNQTSLTFLSSLIQTENLMKARFNPDFTHFTSRELGHHQKDEKEVAKRSQSENQQHQLAKNESEGICKRMKKLQEMASTLRRTPKKDNALCKIVGEVDLSTSKIESKIMEETIHKARTYTLIPDRINAISSEKKKKNRTLLKQDFKNFIGKQQQDRKNSLTHKPNQDKETISTQYIKRKQITQSTYVPKGDLYHFLHTQQLKNKRVKTDTISNCKNNPNLSKRMVQMMLKKQLGIYNDNFNFVDIGARRSFKLNTQQH